MALFRGLVNKLRVGDSSPHITMAAQGGGGMKGFVSRLLALRNAPPASATPAAAPPPGDVKTPITPITDEERRKKLVGGLVVPSLIGQLGGSRQALGG